MISINQAASKGIDRLRKPNWSDTDDHLKIDIIDGKVGPWLHFYSTLNEHINGRNPVDILSLEEDMDEACFEPYLEPDSKPKE